MKSAKLKKPEPLKQPDPQYYKEIMKDNYAEFKNKFDASPQDPSIVAEFENLLINKYVKKTQTIKENNYYRNHCITAAENLFDHLTLKQANTKNPADSKLLVKNAMSKLNIRSNKASTSTVPIEDIQAFHSIYSTNAGASGINTNMRNGMPLHVSFSKVIHEMQERHGQDYFTGPVGVKSRALIEVIVTLINEGKGNKYIDTLYNTTNTGLKTYYRGQGLTEEGFKQMKSIQNNNKLYYSKSPLSASVSRKTALEFANKATNARGPAVHKLILKISGTSATLNRGSLRVEGESEAIFSHLASFKIGMLTYDRETLTYYLELSEVSDASNETNSQTIDPLPY